MTKRQQDPPSRMVAGAITVGSTTTAFAERRRRPPRPSTLALWFVNVCALAVGAAVASLFVLMPVSLDLEEAITAGTTPWFDAARAIAFFGAELVAVAASLALWHRTRFAALAWVLTASMIVTLGAIAWVIERDWF